MQKLINRLMPFVFAGIALVILFFGIMLLVYLIFFGLIIGIILFAINWLRSKLAPPTAPPKQQPPSGRIIDADDWDEK